MDLIRTGLELRRTVRNASRFREIVAVLSRNGFDEFIIKTGLHRRIPRFVLPKSRRRIFESLHETPQESWSATLGYRLRKSFEELGPSFVKLGQLIATREDVFPADFIAELRKLQDQVRGIPFAEARGIVERELGKGIGEVFSRFDEGAVGTASIAVAYRAQLVSGEEVVVKLRRPNIARTIEVDFSLMHFIISRIEKVSEEMRHLSLSRIVKDFAAHVRAELDFRVEALNCERLRANIERVDTEGVFRVPKVHRELSTEEVLVLELIDGIPFSDTARIAPHRAVVQPRLEKGIRIFVHNLLVDGFFHADLHGGNFFFMPDGKIGIIDFGSVGLLGKRSRANLVALLYSLVTFNFENLAHEFLEVAEFDTIPDVDALTADIKSCLAPYIGLTVQQTNFAQLFRAVTATLAEHDLYLPREWFVVFRALVTLDGVGKSLGVDFDVFTIINEDIRKIIKSLVTKEELIEEAAWLGRDVLSSLRGLPRHARWFLREFARRGYAFEVVQRGYEESLKSLARSVQFAALVIAAGSAGLGGIWMLGGRAPEGLRAVPAVVWFAWIAAALLFIAGLRALRRQ